MLISELTRFGIIFLVLAVPHAAHLRVDLVLVH